MNEFELIERVTRHLPTNRSTLVGAGDDCAVLDLGNAECVFLFKTDAVVEGVHFPTGTEPRRVGHKALARCLSDVAAMAGTPTHALVTLALPATFDVAYVEGIYAGLTALAARHEVAVVGGETTSNPGGILLSVALLGTAVRGRYPLRSGARPGDAVFVTGELGGSRAGKHLDFEPRLQEARWLAERFTVHAMIDLSDGLAGDLRRVLTAAGVGAELLAEAVPVSRAARNAARTTTSGRSAWNAALTDGEDFELLFTVPARLAVSLRDAWTEKWPELRLSCIGKITASPGLTVRDRQGCRPLNVDGYAHFQKR